MSLANILGPSVVMTGPPPGSVNVRVGKGIEGPGGRWIPCATEISEGVFCSGLFQVGPGQRQVCATDAPVGSADEALTRAVALASSAAA